MPGVCGDLYNLFFNFVPIRGGQRPGQAAQLARRLVTDVVPHFCNTTGDLSVEGTLSLYNMGDIGSH